jgi:5-hydroxyisourate hydrolase
VSVAQIIATKSKIVYTSVDRLKGLFKALSKPPFFHPPLKTSEHTMGLSTHVLDTMHGCPAAGMQVALYTTQGDQATLVKSFTLNHDGRNPDGMLYDHASLRKGTYRLVFNVSDYFKAKGVELPEPNFLNKVSLDFGVAHEDQHYHVPLLASPWSYSTYRGS